MSSEENPRARTQPATTRRGGVQPLTNADRAALSAEDELDRRGRPATRPRARPREESRSILPTAGQVFRATPVGIAATLTTYVPRLLTGQVQFTGAELEPLPESVSTGRGGRVVDTNARGRSTNLTRGQFDEQLSTAHETQVRANRATRGESAERSADRNTGGGGGGGGGGTGRTAASRDRPNRAPVGRPVDDPTPVETDRSTPRITTTGAGVTQAFSISSFRSEIAENDVLPSHSYLVTFAPFRSGYFENAPLTDFVTNKRNTLLLRCENVVLPTPSLLEEENIRRYGYGPVEKVPYGVQFSDVTLTWIRLYSAAETARRTGSSL
jgi:hypothetical protein